MKNLLHIFILLITNIAFCQINYCDNCGIFDNDNPETYKKISKIEVKKYKGSPIFHELNDESKTELLEETINVNYNSFGKVEEFISTEWLSGFESTISSYKLTYDGEEQVISIINQSGPSEHKETFKYDKVKNEAINYVFNYDNVTVDRIIKYKFNENGNVLNRKEYFENGTLYKDDSFKYDNKGNEIFSDYYGVKTSTTIIYNNSGKIVSKHSTNNYKKGGETKFKYNQQGQKIEEERKNLNGGLISKIIYTYDNNLMTKQTEIYYSKGKESSKEVKSYFFNGQGNWIREETTRNDILISICYREINYSN
ncbi:hypothetical protein [Flavobacterium luminosum]|uniref:RHS repeat protein n=1 Tax=Flavobacterium luminosum TaxID=2949086 RepID=A0ABT0TRE6_9FLAO|nr:hypothetical protein [Flavobacterium sp. HXWNR70]MCL9810084.1 hypothetical protein [Flavobacterium sp. HXWNR70]